MTTDKQVAPLSSLAVTRFRRLLLQSSRIHAPSAHHMFVYSLFRGSGGTLARMPNSHREILNAIQCAGELSSWISKMLASEDTDEQTALYQQISNRLCVYSYCLDDLALVCCYDVDTGDGDPVLDQVVTQNANGASLTGATYDWVVVCQSQLASVDHNNNRASIALPVLGAALKPILDLLTSKEMTSAGDSSQPTELGQTIRLAAAQACNWQPELAVRNTYANKVVPDAILATPNGQLMCDISDIADTGSGLMQAITSESGMDLHDFHLSAGFTGDPNHLIGPWNINFVSFKKNKGASMWAIPNLAGLTDNLNNMEKNFTTLLNSVEADINDVMEAAKTIGQVISDIEQIYDIVARVVPEVVAVVAFILAL